MLIFLHMPRCGGTSIRDALRRYNAPSISHWYGSLWNAARLLPAIERADRQDRRTYSAHMEFDECLLRWPIFTILRDPVERMLSGYEEVQHAAATPARHRKSLARVLELPNDDRPYHLKDNAMTRIMAGGVEDLDLALQNLGKLAHIGRLEALDKTLAWLLSKGLDMPPTASRKNARRRGKCPGWLRELVTERNAMDRKLIEAVT